ncbi:aminoglycoside adenylyltransferase domain-containing protein [Actinocatenispora rupis]|uniref:Adenylyltransferase AadA C-terminal domain-containing protein n=1 Tax=Actinocatenispora rupis TaxID=519421 RepID=A0A8J3J9A0_9ACTN|nr:aminoglycoside adenylyltransferase domain-containing protein [Actinocatenispora rupis]GID14215.1 hypothetical protein Aru02nite_51040 [Actinocatenispora rupis]
MDGDTERYVGDVAAVAAAALGPGLVGAYLHGSAVLGGFDVRRSDVDVLVVCAGPLPAAVRAVLADGLRADLLPCPATGLELSVVTLAAARHPTARPAYEVHVTTAAGDAKVVHGDGQDGDPDLVLHFAVCRTAGRPVGSAAPVADVFAPVPDGLVRAQLADELRWAAHAPGEYAVLNACRAWRFAVDGAIVSKVDGGRWALDRLSGTDRGLVRAALDRQLSRPATDLDPEAVHRYVHGVLPRLTAP